MAIKKFGVLLLTIVLVMMAASSLAQEKQKSITFGVEPSWRPLEFLDDDNKLVGYSVDYFNAVCQEIGYVAEFKQISWDNIFKGLEAGEYDAIMASVTITTERRQKMEFTIPYYVVRQSLLVAKDSKVTNIRQLKGRKVGSLFESTATEIVEKSPGLISAPSPSIDEAVADLVKGEVDAVICEDVVASNFLKQPEYSDKIKMATIINTPGAEELYAVALRKGDLKTLVLLNDGIKAVKDKGIESGLRQKWFSGVSK